METASDQELKKHLYISILCGGGGKRLWPRSRKKTPKQFIDLFGNSTPFERTINRAKKITTSDKIFVITNYDYVDDVLRQGPGLILRNIIAEPMAKDTALAMAVSAAIIYKQDPEAVIINLASDAAIIPEDEELFRKEMVLAAKAAQETEMIVTVGIKPSFPHTGYGYIQAGEKKAAVNGKTVYQVAGFTEKPNYPTAQKFIKTGKYYWNANLYTWKARVILKTFAKVAPGLSRSVQKISEGIGRAGEAELIHRVYQKAEGISIDYAISEKADNLVLLPGTFSWEDIGDWKVVYGRSKKDKSGNAVIRYGEKGSYVALESKNNLIHFHNKLLALVGVDDLVVVDTGDVLLICHRDKAQKVKQIVQKLKKEGRLEYL